MSRRQSWARGRRTKTSSKKASSSSGIVESPEMPTGSLNKSQRRPRQLTFSREPQALSSSIMPSSNHQRIRITSSLSSASRNSPIAPSVVCSNARSASTDMPSQTSQIQVEGLISNACPTSALMATASSTTGTASLSASPVKFLIADYVKKWNSPTTPKLKNEKFASNAIVFSNQMT
jgi:hypothetical protein